MKQILLTLSLLTALSSSCLLAQNTSTNTSSSPTYSEFCDYLNDIIQAHYALGSNTYLQDAAAIKNRYPSALLYFKRADSLEQIIDNNGYVVSPKATLYWGDDATYVDDYGATAVNAILGFSTEQDASFPNVPWHAVVSADRSKFSLINDGVMFNSSMEFENGNILNGDTIQYGSNFLYTQGAVFVPVALFNHIIQTLPGFNIITGGQVIAGGQVTRTRSPVNKQ